jgi:signal peptidase I
VAADGVGTWWRRIDARVVVGVVAGACLLATVVLFIGFRSYRSATGSMEPSIEFDDWLLARRTDSVGRGDVAIVRRVNPAAGSDDASPTLTVVARVIGVGGDVVDAVDGRVRIGGDPLTEDYLAEGATTADFGPVEVPEGWIFVMGDNRGNAQDSRFFGPVPEAGAEGRVVRSGLPQSPHSIAVIATGSALVALGVVVVRDRRRRPAPELPPIEFSPRSTSEPSDPGRHV